MKPLSGWQKFLLGLRGLFGQRPPAPARVRRWQPTGRGQRLWQLIGEGGRQRGLARANTRSEARAEFKRQLGVRGKRLPTGLAVRPAFSLAVEQLPAR